ncbi:WW domain-containing oxidoreductase [Hypsizygus marmoreus]|uniref:WW domain-containing oxidoreductase n=1 Tax=Hypsizygus marmoreus TaxID=39966 RepID=A0A369J3M6_HYPMA|nr:WW domain-containing oxidoreductase [Hypsizygus marmoreus]
MGRLTFSGFVYDQWTKVPPVATADLTGKTVMVIGANTGLGFEAAKHFARMSPGRLILGCRSPQRGEAAIEKLKQETGYTSSELWIIDLAQFSSVIAFADKFENDGGRLDILVENAACAPTSVYSGTVDGWETALQVNYLSLSLLALRLLPRMVQTSQDHSTKPRLVVVTSEVHFLANPDKKLLDAPHTLRTLGNEEYCTSSILAARYNDSKLLNVFFFRALNDRLPVSSNSVIVNGVNPGYCYSELRRSFTGVRAALDWLMEKALARTTEEGSRMLVYSAVGGEEDGEELRGEYISSAKVAEASDFVISEEGGIVQNKIWEEMLEILSEVDHKVHHTVNKYLAGPGK